MTIEQLIKILEDLPQDLPIRLVNKDNDQENIWLTEIEFSGIRSGYEVSGEIRFIGRE